MVFVLFRTLNHGRVEIGVHIADVSHFVKPNSPTDQEAQSRSTSIYLADRRYDMLPSILSVGLCSLLSNVDRLVIGMQWFNNMLSHYVCIFHMSRYAVSVLWKLDSDYQVKSVWYGRTIIRSKYKLAYEVYTYNLCAMVVILTSKYYYVSQEMLYMYIPTAWMGEWSVYQLSIFVNNALTFFFIHSFCCQVN